VLARIDDVALRDAFLSARSGVRSTEASLELARRNLERSERLSQAGAVADRDLESTRVQATNAEGALADARSRLASAQKQLDNATIRAPFVGIVSERAVHTGDVVQVGGALYSVVQPGKLRLEGSVPADQIGRLKVGTTVEFSVRGFDRRFSGRIERINPVVEPSTRQVKIYVEIPNTDRTLVAGLFAEGRVATERKTAIAAPIAAIDDAGTGPRVHKIKDGRVSLVPVTLGVRDEAAEQVELASGVAAGDTLLLGSAQGVTAGARVRVLAQEVER
jgi:membrane fusion protein (multidrug efflux system)